MSLNYPHFGPGETPFRVVLGDEKFGRIPTSSTAWTELVRYSLIDYPDDAGSLTVRVTGVKLSNHDAVLFVQPVGVKRASAGDADIIGTLPSPVSSHDPSLSTAAIRVTADGTDIVVEVKAPSASTMVWCGQVSVNHLFGFA